MRTCTVYRLTTDDTLVDDRGHDYGDDPAVDPPWARCADGDMSGCNELSLGDRTAWSSRHYEFARTCGDALTGARADVIRCSSLGPDGVLVDQRAMFPGEDPELDALWDACDEGDSHACSDLSDGAASGSDCRRFGETCGGRSTQGLPGRGELRAPAPVRGMGAPTTAGSATAAVTGRPPTRWSAGSPDPRPGTPRSRRQAP